MRGRTICLSLLILFLSSLCGVRPVSAETTYTDPELHFSFIVPSGYSPLPPSFFDSAASAFPDVRQLGYASSRFKDATVVVSLSSDIPDTVSLDELAARNRLLPGFVVGGQGNQKTSLGNLPALRQESVGPPFGGRVHLLEITALDGGTAYTFTFSAKESDFSAFIKEAMTVADSFTLAPRQGPSAIGKDGQFMDMDGRFGFAIPAGWKVNTATDDPIVVSLYADNPLVDASVAVQAFSEGDTVTLDDYVAAQGDAVDEQYPGNRVTSRSKVLLGGESAIRVAYQVTRNGTPTCLTHVIAIHNSMGYVFETVTSLQSADAIEQPVSQILHSWHFI